MDIGKIREGGGGGGKNMINLKIFFDFCSDAFRQYIH